MRNASRVILSLLLLSTLALPTLLLAQARTGLSPDDEQAIKATIQAYRTAWLANDSQGVLRTFTRDAVLMPAHGAAAIKGIAAIEKYWFSPGGPPTTITQLDITVDELQGDATFAYARGLDTVAWTVTEKGTTRRHSHPGTYVNIMRKQPDGTWRIHLHMWDDGAQTVE
jgi:uncharacterized protein (TIGR02246 family)